MYVSYLKASSREATLLSTIKLPPLSTTATTVYNLLVDKNIFSSQSDLFLRNRSRSTSWFFDVPEMLRVSAATTMNWASSHGIGQVCCGLEISQQKVPITSYQANLINKIKHQLCHVRQKSSLTRYTSIYGAMDLIIQLTTICTS